MPRFYFTTHDEWGEAPDAEGADLRDVENALLRAAAGARSMMSDTIRRGTLDLTASIGIENEVGAEVARLTFREAVKIRE